MTWWAWLLLWTVLVLGAGAVLFVLGRRLWRQATAVARELGAAADRFASVSSAVDNRPRRPPTA